MQLILTWGARSNIELSKTKKQQTQGLEDIQYPKNVDFYHLAHHIVQFCLIV